MSNRFPDMDTYFMEINHVLLASRGYEYDGFLHFLNSIVFISLNDNLWFFLYNFLFVVYFYSNQIWCIESSLCLFRNPLIRNKNCLWRPCLLMNRDEMSNLYRGPSIHAFYQISVHLGKRFQRRRFSRNTVSRSINKHGRHRPFLFLIGWFLKNLLLWNRFFLCQMNQNLVGIILGRSSIKIAHLVPIR
jgi:hypothetical protein